MTVNPRSIRVRTSAAAVGVVAVVLVVASIALVSLLRRSLTNDVKLVAHARALQVAAESPSNRGEIVSDDDDEFVQVIDQDGSVATTTANVAGLTRAAGDDGSVVELPIDDDPFIVAATADENGDMIIVGRSLDTVIESSTAVTTLLAIGLPLLLATLATVIWRVVGAALRPVEAIRSEVAAISAEHLNRRVPVPDTSDEIARLASTMNDMLMRLEEGADRQRRFVSDASHELRSPVATIRNHAEVALAHPSSISVNELAEAVLAEDLRLQGLLEDLLLLTRMAEQAPRDLMEVDLDDVVLADVVRRDGRMTIDTRRVSGGRVAGDRRALERLVTNLVDNACRHARATVSIALTEAGGLVSLRVEDDGVGIPPADRARIFARFVRLEEARDRDSGGSGLGLAIVAEVVAHHGGTVEVTDSELGGCCFEVHLPAADAGLRDVQQGFSDPE